METVEAGDIVGSSPNGCRAREGRDAVVVRGRTRGDTRWRSRTGGRRGLKQLVGTCSSCWRPAWSEAVS